MVKKKICLFLINVTVAPPHAKHISHQLYYLLWHNKTPHGKSRKEEVAQLSKTEKSKEKWIIIFFFTTERFLAGLSCEEGESPEALWNEWLDWGLFNWLPCSGCSFLKADSRKERHLLESVWRGRRHNRGAARCRSQPERARDLQVLERDFRRARDKKATKLDYETQHI